MPTLRAMHDEAARDLLAPADPAAEQEVVDDVDARAATAARSSEYFVFAPSQLSIAWTLSYVVGRAAR